MSLPAPALVLVPALLAACGADPCARQRDPVARENCWFEKASQAYKADPSSLPQALAPIPTPASRDLVRLRLAIDDPSLSASLCRSVETDPAREKCRQVLGRPHLRSRPQAPLPQDQAMPPSRPPGEP